jgi:type II secretory ATPase GspE/PulE/Tfp pilus assembly ATPase PilB-like protein
MFRKNKEEFNAVEEINALINAAVKMRASDIHIEPFKEFIRVRFRIDGALVKYNLLPIRKRDEIIAIIKVMAALDSTVKKGAQDGKISFAHDNGFIEIRASVLPFKHGEKIVLRLQNTGKAELDIEKLGMNEGCLPAVKKIVSGRQGLILVTGSSGSGKTTTIYSVLDHINSDELNIVTVEDPIEYEIPGFIQIQMSKALQMDYAEVLRAVLRQDPDVLVIGEIRDPDTARVAIRAALTGHLVIASLHTNDSIDTLIRLREMGIESYLIGAALKLITYQRLVRVLCPECKTPSVPKTEQAAMFNLQREDTTCSAKGCRHCSGTGYFGRKPIFEILVVDDEIIEILANSHKSHELRSRLRTRLQSNLLEEARKMIVSGTTSCEEAMKAYA